MAGPAERSALAALDAARPVIARLDASRDSEDVAADLIESWGAVETALRSLVGGSSLGGQALIRELRGRQMLSLEQANSLAEFQAARDRAQRTDYRPSPGDVNAARDGFLKLESGLMAAINPPPAVLTPVSAARVAATRPMPSGEEYAGTPVRRFPWLAVALGLLALALVGVGTWALTRGGTDDDVRDGLRLLSEGKREVARDVFKKAARDDADAALPLVYLGRMFRDERRFDSASVYLQAAIRRDPNSDAAHREMAKLLFLQGNYELARTFFIRAIQANAADRESQGYLGCSLIRLGRTEEGRRFIQRAGPGQWEACALPGAPGTPSMVGGPPA